MSLAPRCTCYRSDSTTGCPLHGVRYRGDSITAADPIGALHLYSDDLRAEGAAQMRDRIAAALEREAADGKRRIMNEALSGTRRAYAQGARDYAASYAARLRAGTFPPPAGDEGG